MPPRDNKNAAINEDVLARVLSANGLIIYPFTYQGTARIILLDLDEQGYMLLHRDDL